MRITKRQLDRIIKEELRRVISEHPRWEGQRLPVTSDQWGEVDDELERAAEQESLWDDDIEVSTCCGAQRYGDHDLCIDCGEHADFEYEGAWKRGENESL